MGWARMLLPAALLLAAPATAQRPVTSADSVAAERHRREDERLRTDWAGLARYREANAALGTPTGMERRVVFMGNSIFEQWAPRFATDFAGKPYVGRGISGQVTAQMLVRFRPDVIALRPAAVVILAGTNDVAGNAGPATDAEITGNVESMVQLARASGIRVVLCSILPAAAYRWRPGLAPAARIVALNAMLKDVAARHGATWVDLHAPMADADGGLRAEYGDDGVHPNAAGYAVMAPLVERGIRRALGRR